MAFQVNDLPSKEISSGNGVQTVFSFNFDLFSIDVNGNLDGNDVFAIVDNITLTKVASLPSATEYTVDTVLKQVTFGVAPNNNANVTIFRLTPKERQQGYQPSAEIASDTLNRDINRLWSVTQEQDEDISRSVKLPITSTLSDLELPTPVSLDLLQWNSAANALQNANVTGLGTLTLPVTVANGGTGSTTVTNARTSLGINSVNVKSFGAIGDGVNDDTSSIIAAIASVTSGVIFFPTGQYKVTSTINVKDDIHLVGEGSNSNSGSVILFSLDDGTSLFKSDSTTYLSNFHVRDILCKNPLITAGTGGMGGHCFELYGLGNNSAFERVQILFFGGSAFKIGRQTGVPADHTACGNTLFNQVFIAGSMGEYGFDIDGYVNATWLMCDINSPVMGGFHFTDGVSNQAMINIVGLWYESGAAWAANDCIIMENTNSQPLSVIGSNFQGSATAGGAVVKIIGTTAGRPSLHNITGFNYDFAIDDQVNGYTWALPNPGSVDHAFKSGSLVAEGPLALIDLHDLAGSTTNQRYWRFAVVGNLLAIESRLDNGGAAQNIVFFTHNTRKADFQGQVNATSLTVNNSPIPNTTMFESAEQTISSGKTITLAHGLGVEPKLIQFWIINKVAEHGYSIGDKIPVGPQDDISAVPDATNLVIQMRVAAQFATIQEKATGNPVNTTNTSWNLIVRAWA